MKDLNTLLSLAAEIQEYVSQTGRTLPISQGKMLKDDQLPADLEDFLKTG